MSVSRLRGIVFCFFCASVELGGVTIKGRLVPIFSVSMLLPGTSEGGRNHRDPRRILLNAILSAADIIDLNQATRRSVRNGNKTAIGSLPRAQ
jgi:hypothetical protein